MALNYLLSPEFQVSVTSGKPNTGGWIEVFIAGTQTKYFTSCDFNGTKNPFKIPLDSLGQALVLADEGSYDVFVYNRYGSLLFSRYNVSPAKGGGISTASITSEDGSITVTQTATGVDLSVNGHEASVLRATATPLTSDGSFVFTRRQKTGESVDVSQQGNILAKTGWFHYDITAELVWNSFNTNQVSNVTLCSNVNSASDAFDLSYPHSDFVQLSGEWRSIEDNTIFNISVTGIPQGMTVKISDFGIHAINGGGSGSGGEGGATYTGVDGIIVDNDNAEIKPDFDVVQHKLTEGSNISISGNEISANVPTKTSELQNDSGFITSASVPTKTSELQNDSGFITASSVPTKTSELQNDSGFITLSDVPAVNDATLTIQKNGTTVGTFTANSSTNTTVDIAVPIKTSDLQNDSGFITSESLPTVNDATLTIQKNGSTIDTFTANSSTNKTVNIAVPTKTSDLQNDSGFITSSDIPAQAQADWTQTNTQDPSYIQNKPQFASVAMTGSYADLSNTPTIPVVDQTYDASSTNAQSGVAVAQALAGISVDEVPPVTSTDDGKVLTADYTGNVGSYSWEAPQGGLPPSTPADYGKVLTVNLTGQASWEPYGSSGSLDPGAYLAPAETLRLRFGDTTYDPTVQSYASAFDSITRVSEGVYDFSFANVGTNALRRVFLNTFTDYTNNPVDILGMRSTRSYSNPISFFGMFEGCTGLRSAWNIAGMVGSSTNNRESFSYMFSGCTNFSEVHAYDSSTSIVLEGGCKADYMFENCTSLKICDLHISGRKGYFGTSSLSHTFYNCSSLVYPPMITKYVESFYDCFYGCSSLESFSTNPRYFEDAPVIGSPASSVNMYSMFEDCENLKDLRLFNLASFGSASDLSQAFAGCHKLEYAPTVSINANCNADRCFSGCSLLTDTPNWDYSKIGVASSMFENCVSLRNIGSNVAGLASSATNVDSLFISCISVETGVLDCYNALAASSTIQSHSDTFKYTGMYSGNDQRSSIPTSWGGTATT